MLVNAQAERAIDEVTCGAGSTNQTCTVTSSRIAHPKPPTTSDNGVDIGAAWPFLQPCPQSPKTRYAGTHAMINKKTELEVVKQPFNADSNKSTNSSFRQVYNLHYI
jgi:hypothetical protein